MVTWDREDPEACADGAALVGETEEFSFERLLPTPRSCARRGRGDALLDWRIAEWGTKWDLNPGDACAEGALEDGRVELEFDTAWSPPSQAVAAYALTHPNLNIELLWAEPGNGACGSLSASGGDIEVDQPAPGDQAAFLAARGWDVWPDWLGEGEDTDPPPLNIEPAPFAPRPLDFGESVYGDEGDTPR